MDDPRRRVELTERGRLELETLCKRFDGFWQAASRRERWVEQALCARYAYRRDRDYVVVDDAVRIVDAETGRAAPDRSWEQGLVVGAAVAVSAPWGTYDSDHLINAGANRWSVKPSIGMSKRHGAWQWELKAGVNFYEDNDEFFNGIHLEQDPLYSTSVHLIRFFSRGWLSVDGNYFAGGRTNKNDVRQDDRQDNSRWGITWTRPVGQRHILKFSATTGVVTRIGNDFDSLAVGWLYRL